MFRKTGRQEADVIGKVVTDSYSETKILVPITVHKLSKHGVTLRVGKNFHYVQSGQVLTIEVDLTEANLVAS